MPDDYADLQITDDSLDELEQECIHEEGRWAPKHVLTIIRALKAARAAMPVLPDGTPTIDFNREDNILVVVAPLGRMISVMAIDKGIVLDSMPGPQVQDGDGPCMVSVAARRIGEVVGTPPGYPLPGFAFGGKP